MWKQTLKNIKKNNKFDSFRSTGQSECGSGCGNLKWETLQYSIKSGN